MYSSGFKTKDVSGYFSQELGRRVIIRGEDGNAVVQNNDWNFF